MDYGGDDIRGRRHSGSSNRIPRVKMGQNRVLRFKKPENRMPHTTLGISIQTTFATMREHMAQNRKLRRIRKPNTHLKNVLKP